jgi:hypothetical protein
VEVGQRQTDKQAKYTVEPDRERKIDRISRGGVGQIDRISR